MDTITITLAEEHEPIILITLNGPPGIPGSAGAGIVVPFASPAATWAYNHNLGRYVTVETLDSSGAIMDADVHQDTLNAVSVTFAAPTTGTLVLT